MDAWRSTEPAGGPARAPARPNGTAADARRESRLLDVVDHLRQERRLMHSEMEALRQRAYVAEDRLSKKEKASLFGTAGGAPSSSARAFANGAVCIPMDFDLEEADRRMEAAWQRQV